MTSYRKAKRHLRQTARQMTAPGRASWDHVRAGALRHSGLADDADVEEATIQAPRTSAANTSAEASGPGRPAKKRPVPGPVDGAGRPVGSDLPESPGQPAERSQRGSKELCSPPASVVQQRGSSPPTPGRSRAMLSERISDFDRGSKHPAGRQLRSPDDDVRPRTPQTRPSQLAAAAGPRRSPQTRSHRRPQASHRAPSPPSEHPSVSEMIRQPETKPISQDKLVAEVKGIYAGLVMIESKCIEYDSSQEANQLSQEQYHALIALHRSVLHEHHDFFLASQHPSASEALRRLASKYAMPARMWRHGIHSFLELLRHKLPASREHMLTFIYIAYSMIALLYETVPAFEDTWIECLGDLGRYRMAIEDDDIRDREIWTGVSRYWYSKASDKQPTTGRLYHHLAILARPNALQQLYYYAKSLCVPIPFSSARDSIMTLFGPLLTASSHQRLEPVDAAFVRVHGILFSGKSMEQLEPSMNEFLALLDGRIGSTHSNWLEAGCYVGISLSCSLLGFGAESNVLIRAVSRRQDESDAGMKDASIAKAEMEEGETFEQALSFAVRTYEIVLRRWGDKNTLSCIHTTMVFLYYMSRYPAAMAHLEDRYPWKLTAIMLNYLLKTSKFKPRIDGDGFPEPERGELPYPLPEDYAMRGLIYVEDLGWFNNPKIDKGDRYLEPASKAGERQERILWLGRRIASSGKWLRWDDETRIFSVAEKFDVVLDGLPDEDEGEVTLRRRRSGAGGLS